LTTSPAAVACRGLSVAYGDVPALTDVDLELGAGQVLALLGASGSGKTTLLHTLAGFIRPTTGEVLMDGHLVAGPHTWVAPEHRKVGLVFQGAALWPHLNVLDTVAYPIRRRGCSRAEARAGAQVLLERVGLTALAARRPAQLSGGEQQRVGLARALARDPALFLFDEPTAHLDPHLRGVVLDEIARRSEALGAAAVYATHDATEALAVADLVAVLRDGRVVQVGTPGEIYERPMDLDVARLTGPVSLLESGPANGPGSSGQARLVRPDWVSFGGDIPGTVSLVRYRGPHTDYAVDVVGGTLLVRETGRTRRNPGAVVGVSIHRTWDFGLMDGSDPTELSSPASKKIS
jgi:ABC-type Fe3+/spermidine/putrescine transport system ATPase subunit